MTATSTALGNPIEYNNGWQWADTQQPITQPRSCNHCHQQPIALDAATGQGADPCLGILHGVKSACCGHGDPTSAYALLDDGTRLEGQAIFNLREAGQS